MTKRLLVVAAACLFAFPIGKARAADPPGMLNPVTILCPNATNTGYVACYGSGSNTTGAATKTDISMTLTTGGTAQQVVAAASAGVVRHVLLQNLSADPYGCSFTTATPVVGAVGTFILKGATSTTSGDGGSYTTPPGMNDNQALTCIATTTGDKLFGSAQ